MSCTRARTETRLYLKQNAAIERGHREPDPAAHHGRRSRLNAQLPSRSHLTSSSSSGVRQPAARRCPTKARCRLVEHAAKRAELKTRSPQDPRCTTSTKAHRTRLADSQCRGRA